MKNFDSSLCADIADAVGLSDPAFIEKDYYAVQLLNVISQIKLSEKKLIFAGGTCLTKAHLQILQKGKHLQNILKN